MSDSEDDDHAYFGTPLEPLDEDNITKKKPLLIQDQIVTDKHGKRRFHGAFTGGFSAGFFNTVGSLEGWTPSQFKSSRESKADVRAQRPEDFMDDEDTDEFGIAPVLLRAKPEYSGSKPLKRKLNKPEGPIPGDPVLENILEPAKETVGMKLLMRLGWKPGQGVGPMLTWFEKMSDDMNPEDMGLSPDVLFPPDPVKEHFIKPKADRFGLGYVGLSKEPVLQQHFSLFDDPLKMTDNKKKLSIRGQAFGVGAFEVEDDDIYAKDDMSQYDFALETSASIREAKRKEREENKMKQLAICDKSGVLSGFEPCKNNTYKKKYYPPPELPPGFDPTVTRKTRFDSAIRGNPDSIKGKHIITSDDRAAILGLEQKRNETPLPSTVEDAQRNDNEPEPISEEEMGFRPFVSDPKKQSRYERYLGFIRIGAKDALKNIQPPEMTEWEREREVKEFEQAAKLYRPLTGMMGERFSRGGMLDDKVSNVSAVAKVDPVDVDPWVNAAKEKKFGKLTRFISDWDPMPLLCKRMNIPEPRGSGTTLASVAEESKRRKPKFSVFDFMDTSKEFGMTSEKTEDKVDKVIKTPLKEIPLPKEDLEDNIVEDKGIKLPAPLLDPKIVEADDPQEKMDLFKAIFESSDDESESEDAGSSKTDSKIPSSAHMDNVEKPANNKNILRNTSPPRGIFANLDLDALKPKPLPPKDKKENADKTNDAPKEENKEVDPSLLYGPSLPSKPVFISKTTKADSVSSSSEDEWVEKGKEKPKKKKHSKKHKKDKKKDKHKHKKKKKKH